jgi:hypothetical protein
MIMQVPATKCHFNRRLFIYFTIYFRLFIGDDGESTNSTMPQKRNQQKS